MLFRAFLLFTAATAFAPQMRAEETDIVAPKSWRGERIPLPAPFAKDMQWKGSELIRFAPGMFKADSDSFFSYVILFEIEAAEKPATKELMREILTYYRGLARAVMQDPKLDVSEFSVDLDAAETKDADRFTGKLTWLEPFVTKKSQVLHLEVDIWQPKDKRQLVFACVSPQKKSAKIWTQMRDIRAASVPE